MTKRQSLEQVERSGGNAAELHNHGELPAPVRYLWGWFCDLNDARGHTGFGPSPITYQDIMAWAILMGIAPSPWDVEQIRMLDRTYFSEKAKHHESLTPKKTPPQK